MKEKRFHVLKKERKPLCRWWAYIVDEIMQDGAKFRPSSRPFFPVFCFDL